jgi:hypothetical protein
MSSPVNNPGVARKASYTTGDLAEILGVHASTIVRACRDFPGLSVRYRQRHHFRPHTVERLLLGLSFEEVAQMNLAERERLSA